MISTDSSIINLFKRKKCEYICNFFKDMEVDGLKQYAFLRSYVRDSEKFYKGIGDADKNTKAQLAEVTICGHYGIDKNARFVFRGHHGRGIEKREKVQRH